MIDVAAMQILIALSLGILRIANIVRPKGSMDEWEVVKMVYDRQGFSNNEYATAERIKNRIFNLRTSTASKLDSYKLPQN